MDRKRLALDSSLSGREHMDVLLKHNFKTVYDIDEDDSWCTIFENSYMRLAVLYQRHWGQSFRVSNLSSRLDIKDVRNRAGGWFIDAEVYPEADKELQEFYKKYAASVRLPRSEKVDIENRKLDLLFQEIDSGRATLTNPRYRLEEDPDFGKIFV